MISSREPHQIITFIITLVGDSNSGKTDLVQRFIDPNYTFKAGTQRSVGLDIDKISSLTRQETYKIQKTIHTPDGDPRTREHSLAYAYRNSSLVLITFNSNEADSLERAEKYIAEAQRLAPPNTPMLLVATMADLPQKVSNKKIIEFVKKHNIKGYTFVSSKANTGVTQLFTYIIEDLLFVNENADLKDLPKPTVPEPSWKEYLQYVMKYLNYKFHKRLHEIQNAINSTLHMIKTYPIAAVLGAIVTTALVGLGILYHFGLPFIIAAYVASDATMIAMASAITVTSILFGAYMGALAGKEANRKNKPYTYTSDKTLNPYFSYLVDPSELKATLSKKPDTSLYVGPPELGSKLPFSQELDISEREKSIGHIIEQSAERDSPAPK